MKLYNRLDLIEVILAFYIFCDIMSLRIKLFLSYLLILGLCVFSMAIFQYNREKHFRIECLNSRLAVCNNIICNAYETSDTDISHLVCLMPDTTLHVIVIGIDGVVVFDSFSDTLTAETYLKSVDVRYLSDCGYGTDIRFSAPDGTDYYCFAQRLGDMYVCSALPFDISLAGTLSADMDFLYFIGGMLFVMTLLVLFISIRLSENMSTIQLRHKRQLTQNVSHELKTPVSAILGYTESLMSNPDLDVAKQRLFIERTYNQSKRLSALLQDISTLNRLDDSRKLYEKEMIDVVGVILDVVSDNAESALRHGVTVEKRLPPDLILNGNRSLLYSIFRNLLDNAIAYAGDGVTVRISVMHADPQYYYFSFADNGTGIPEEHLDRIFERFYRVDKGRSRKIGGTGLGLAIVKNAVLFHKGEISVRNSPTGGAEFLFSLRRF